MKKYTIPLLLFLLVGGLGVVLYKLFDLYFSKELSSILLRLLWAATYILFTLKLVQDKTSLLRFNKLTKEQLIVTFIIFLLFGINNYFLNKYSSNFDFIRDGGIFLVTVEFIVNSFYEEFAYRGFIQNYINQNNSKPSTPLSKGNLFASSLMTVSHIGFFNIMDTTFAFTGILLVIVFSLTMGYIRDKGGSIWFLIIVHTIVNFIHLFFNLENY